MKKLIYFLILIVIVTPVFSQKLIDLYRKGTIRLVPDTEYGKGNNWNQVFRSYYDTLYRKPMGNRKSLIILPDGSIVVNHQYRNYYSRFSPDGTFEKEFGIKNAKGIPKQYTYNIEGIINNNTFFTGLDNMGNSVCFDFNGNFIKTLKLNYMTRQMIALPNGKIAVVGWVIWKDKFRDFISLVDYRTNQEKVIWEYYTDRCEKETESSGKESPKGLVHCNLFNYSYFFEKQGAVSFTTMPFSKDVGLSSNTPPQIAFTGNNLVLALPHTGEIMIYNADGVLKSKYTTDFTKNFLSVEEQKEIQQTAIKRYSLFLKSKHFTKWAGPEENQLAIESIIKAMEEDLDKIKDPIPLPAFSTVIKDSDGNLLFFEYPKEANANKFNVWIYENGGKFVCQSSFVCDNYELQINPDKLVYYKGYLYGLQSLKNAEGVPLRLVRFKIENR